jgi:FtsP/CotA-like multicopper oxidase with cupredoxin domain
MTRDRVRVLVGVVLTLALVGPLAWLWWGSRLPATYSASSMGEMQYGGGPRMSRGHDGMQMSSDHVSVRDLDTAKGRRADVVVHLVARQGTIRLASGEKLDGYTLNGTSPGPLIEATVGQLVEVHVRNDDVTDGIALHWHGVDVPNAEDGVAGITQDAVEPGKSFTYRWVAPAAGTYWYHSHQVSHEQVAGGLLGPVLIHPRDPDPQVQDVVALAHLYGGDEAMNGHIGLQRVEARAGQRVRVRLVNTDNGPATAWTGAAYTVVAVDGHDINGPTPVSGKGLSIPAGGRADLELVVPRDGHAVRVQLGEASMAIGPDGSDPPEVAVPEHDVDLLHYGSPARVPFDTTSPDRRFEYSIGRRPGFHDGKPGLWWSVNGHLPPHLPMFVVREGEVVQVTISNHSGDVHPMHLHGHHAVVVSRNGDPVTGSPWWFDSLDVQDGSTYVVAFLADNPGIWMDHCHNLKHAAQGLVTHLMYEGVTTPYELGRDSGNEPE